jgi:hypothetical protein
LETNSVRIAGKKLFNFIGPLTGFVFTCFIILVIPLKASASTFREVEVTCPLCETKFKTHLQMSGTTFGQRLDLKPIGPIAAPWPLAICPKDSFVLFKENFTEPEKDRLRIFVHSKAYQDLVKDYPPYFRLARIYEFLGEDDFTVAYAYVKASWEAENIPAQKGAYQPSLEACQIHLNKYLQTHSEKDKKWETAQLLSGEMERRLGQFDQARERFRQLGGMQKFQSDQFQRIIQFQLDLIQKGDNNPQTIQREKK